MVKHDFAMLRLSLGFIVLLRHDSLFEVRPWYHMMYTWTCFDPGLPWQHAWPAQFAYDLYVRFISIIYGMDNKYVWVGKLG